MSFPQFPRRTRRGNQGRIPLESIPQSTGLRRVEMPASALHLAVCPLDALPRVTASHCRSGFWSLWNQQRACRGMRPFGANTSLGEVVAAPAMRKLARLQRRSESRVPDCRIPGTEQPNRFARAGRPNESVHALRESFCPLCSLQPILSTNIVISTEIWSGPASKCGPARQPEEPARYRTGAATRSRFPYGLIGRPVAGRNDRR